MIYIFQNIFKDSNSDYELRSLIISWFTWFLTVVFAAKSYFLEKKIWEMGIFHWKVYVNMMKCWEQENQVLRFMFVNHSNVKGALDQIYIEIEPKKFFHRILYTIQSYFSEEPERKSSSFYWKVLYYIRNFIWKYLWNNYWVTFLYDHIFYNQTLLTEKKLPPFEVWPKESISIYFTYDIFINDINKELETHNARLKKMWFITSEGIRVSAKLYKKQLPWLNL